MHVFTCTSENATIPDDCVLVHKERYTNGTYQFFCRQATDQQQQISFVIQGVYDEDNFKRLAPVLFQYGNIVPCTWKHLDNFKEISDIVSNKGFNNSNNLYFHVYTTLRGIYQCTSPWVVKVRCDEYYSDWSNFVSTMLSSPVKITCNNVYFCSYRRFPYHASDHVMGGTKDKMIKMFEKALAFLQDGGIPSFAKNAEQVLTIANLWHCQPLPLPMSRHEVGQIMLNNYNVVDVKDMGEYRISCKIKKARIYVTCGNIGAYSFVTPVKNLDQVI